MNTLLNTQPFNTIKQTGRRLGQYLMLAGGAVLLSFQTAAAQDRTITLDEAIKLGLQTSKTLRLSQAQIDEAITRYNQAKDSALPTGGVSYTYSFAYIPANKLTVENNTVFLPRTANANLGTANIAEVLFAGGRYKFAKESTDLLVKVARLDADQNRDQIAATVVNQYYNLYKVLQNKKVVQQNLNSVDQQIHQTQRFFQQGIVTKNDVLRFQLQRSNIELNGIDLESNRKIINYNLDILLGLPTTTQLNIEQIADNNREIAPLSNYLDTALAVRQELKSLDLRTKAADLNIKTIHANQSPTLAATASAYYVGLSANPLPRNGSYVAPITAGLNLSWDFGSLWHNKNKIAEARVQREELIINKDITADNIRNDVNQNYQTYIASVDKVKLLETAIAQANENNRITISRYANSTASATDRADAQTLLYEAQTNLELAKADAGLAYYNLLKATGKLIK